jgi:tetratricopeptide (TPR) repeat protein
MMTTLLARAQAPTPNREHGSSNTAIAVQAEDAFWQGKRHYDANEYEQACEQFQKAYALVSDPNLLYNIAQSYRQLGDCARARANYQQFLRDAAESPLADNAQKQLGMLQDPCPSQPQTTSPAKTPVSAPVNSSAAAQTSVSPRPVVVVRRELSLRDPDAAAHSSADYWAAGLLAGGLVIGATAGVLELWNQHQYSTWQGRDRNLAAGNAPGETDEQWAVRQGENDHLWHSVKRINGVAVAMGIGAGALVATAAVLHFTLARRSEHSAQAKVAECHMTVGATNESFGWALVGRF